MPEVRCLSEFLKRLMQMPSNVFSTPKAALFKHVKENLAERVCEKPLFGRYMTKPAKEGPRNGKDCLSQ